MQITIDTQIKSKVWQNIHNIKNFIEKTCQTLIMETELKAHLKNPQNQIEIAISLVSNSQIKQINKDFRGKNKPTNILSFPFINEKEIQKNGLTKTIKNHQFLILGDMVLALETIRKESLEGNKTFYDHLTHLLLHGILHLIGLDHENEKDAKIMESLEIKILKKLNIQNPYKC